MMLLDWDSCFCCVLVDDRYYIILSFYLWNPSLFLYVCCLAFLSSFYASLHCAKQYLLHMEASNPPLVVLRSFEYIHS